MAAWPSRQLNVHTLGVASPNKTISLLGFAPGLRDSGVFPGRTTPLGMLNGRQRMEAATELGAAWAKRRSRGRGAASRPAGIPPQQ